MSLDLTAVDALIRHLDTGKGAFWTAGTEVDPSRALAVDFIVVNAAGEPLQTNTLTIANLHHLVSQIAILPEEQSHPCAVLNNVWQALKGTQLIGDFGAVKNFNVSLEETCIKVVVIDVADDIVSSSVQCGIATRLMVLRAFCAIQESLIPGFHSWVGAANIAFNAEDGTISIDGIKMVQPAAEEAPAVPALEAPKVKAPAKPRAAKAAKPAVAAPAAKPPAKPRVRK
jgi:hypothetical protein